MWSQAHYLALTLIFHLVLVNSAEKIGNSRQSRQFLSPSYHSLYSLYLRNLNRNLYPELSEAQPLNLSWNGLFDTDDGSEVESRDFYGWFGRFPSSYIRNPEASSLTDSFTACKDGSGLDGVCVPASYCVKYGGRPSASCGLGSVCCVNSISKCGGQVTLNNTYWKSPLTVGSGSTCGLTLTLNNKLLEQDRKICQIRLDFISFTLAQPNTETVCNVDTFQVSGATNTVPIICGDNPNQHMYVNPPSSVTDLQLLFTFGTSTITRSWNIKIALIPCFASYAAPPDCLQYHTVSSGTIRSFNWRDMASAAPRQLANQDYNICFRTENVNSMMATRICFTQCAVTNGGVAFSLSTSAATNQAQATLATCNNDFLLIPGGFDPAVALTTTTNTWDRYCGQALNPVAGGTAVTVCSTAKDFMVTYRTNGDETVTLTQDANTVINTGFCLDFQQRTG